MQTNELLQAALFAFNQIPNTTLNAGCPGGFDKTYAIARAIESQLENLSAK